MPLANVITLSTDSASSLSGLDLSKYPNMSVKPAEMLWNDMQIEDVNDSTARSLYAVNAEIIKETSGFTQVVKWNWTDFLVEQSIENDAVFVFVPHAVIYPNEQENVMKATMALKTGFVDFFKKHQRTTGKIKHFVVNSGNVFHGVGLVVWQCQEILSRMEPGKNLSLLQLKTVFERYAQRTKTVSILDCGSVNSQFRDRIIERGLFERLSSPIKRKQWLSVTFNGNSTKVSDRVTLESQLAQHLADLVVVIEKQELTFPRVIISCSNQQWKYLSNLDVFKQLNRFIEGTPVKLMHQQPSISAQILTGQNSIHISYSQK